MCHGIKRAKESMVPESFGAQKATPNLLNSCLFVDCFFSYERVRQFRALPPGRGRETSCLSVFFLVFVDCCFLVCLVVSLFVFAVISCFVVSLFVLFVVGLRGIFY